MRRQPGRRSLESWGARRHRPRFALFLAAVLVLLCGAGVAGAESAVVGVPGADWYVVVEGLPRLARYEARTVGDAFQYLGRTESGGITVSVHVEQISEGDNVRCRERYWAGKNLNPMIVRETIVREATSAYAQVTYLIDGEYQGQYVKMANAHFYMVHGGKCVDVHVSKVPHEAGDTGRLAAYGKGVRIRGLK